jgi:hypothetical protein
MPVSSPNANVPASKPSLLKKAKSGTLKLSTLQSKC